MITLQSVRLVNFRLIEDSTFTPGETGITGIFGANGTGKSSFLDGTMWALYGVLPDGVSAENIRREDADLSEECFVEATFIHDGQEITVNRSIRNKSNTSVLYVYLDGEKATGPSVKVGQKWIIDRLGVDAKGFSTAFVVLQKELDTLVTARPAERRALIEKLSGIDKMSKALETARKILNQERKNLDLVSGDPEDVALAASIVEAKQADIEEMEARVSDLKEKIEDREEYARSAQETLLELEDTLSEKEALEAQKSDVEHKIGFYSENLETARAELSQLEKAKPSKDPQEELAEVNERMKEVAFNISEHSRISYEINNFEVRKAAKIEELQGLIASSKRDINALENSIEAEKELYVEVVVDSTIAENIEKFNLDNEDLKSRLSRANGKIEDTKTSITLLTHDDHSQCPTCNQEISSPASIIENLESIVSDLEASSAQLRESIKENDAKIAELTQSANEQDESIRVNSARLEKIAALENSLSEAVETLTSREQELDKVQAWENDVVNPHNIEELDEEKETLMLRKQDILNAKEKLENYNNALKRVEAIESSIATLNTSKAQNSAALAALSAPENLVALIAESKQNYSQQSSLLDSLKAELTEANTALLVDKERLASAQRDYERELSSYNSKLEALKKLEIKGASVEVLDEFRKAQIARIAPELSETATGLISNMTSGRYVEINLDENFTPFVTNSAGKTKSAYTLSGGEISVVALALRMAIGDLITGGQGGLLWLDEVLTAQDAERRASLVETIRSLSARGRQIIMINHTQEASDVVDKSVRLELQDGGSRIIEG